MFLTSFFDKPGAYKKSAHSNFVNAELNIQSAQTSMNNVASFIYSNIELEEAIAFANGDPSLIIAKATTTLTTKPFETLFAVYDAASSVYNILGAAVNTTKALTDIAISYELELIEDEEADNTEFTDGANDKNIINPINEDNDIIAKNESETLLNSINKDIIPNISKVDNKTELAKIFASSSYKTLSKKIDYVEQKESGTKYEFLADSEEDEVNDLALFKAIAFVSHETKEIMIANAGTMSYTASQTMEDVFADVMLAGGLIPKAKFAAIKNFIEKIKSSANNFDIENYTFNTTGHSLGGFLADITAVELMAQGFSVKSSETFDNPGAFEPIQNALNNKLFSFEDKEAVNIEQIKEKISFISNQAMQANIVNTANSQMGEIRVTIKNNFPDKLQKLKKDISHDYEEIQETVQTLEKNSWFDANALYKLYEISGRFYNYSRADKEALIQGFSDKINAETENYTSLLEDIEKLQKTLPKVIESCTKLSFSAITECPKAIGKSVESIKHTAKSLVKAYDKAYLTINKITNLPGHSLGSFEESNEHNSFKVLKGYGNNDTKLVLDVDAEFADNFVDLTNTQNTSFENIFSNYNEYNFNSVDLSVDGKIVKTVSMYNLQKFLYPEDCKTFEIAHAEKIAEDAKTISEYAYTPNSTETLEIDNTKIMLSNELENIFAENQLLNEKFEEESNILGDDYFAGTATAA